MDLLEQPTVQRVDDAFVLDALLQDAAAGRYEASRRDARLCEALADALDYARRHPEVYVRADLDADDPLGRRTPPRHEIPPLGGDAELAVRCAAAEAASRLCVSEQQIRSLAGTAQHARERLPHAWHAARQGLITIAHVDAILDQLGAFADHPDLIDEFDRLLTDVALRATASATRRTARHTADRLTARTRTQRHADAFARRRVYVEDVADQMSWLHVLMPAHRAHAVDRALTATAKRMPAAARDGRTPDQIRADLCADLLTGERPSERPGGRSGGFVKTKVFVTVPLDRMTPEAQASVRPARAGTAALDLNTDCLIPGEGPIDDATARQLLLDAGAFTRVITDPVTGAILDLDRRSRRVTPAQRAWLTVAHGTCRRDGCDRLAIDADIDHHCAYHGPRRGATDLANLDPLCDPDHALKDTTTLEHRRRGDGTIEVRYPTGHTTTDPFAGLEARVRALLDRAAAAARQRGDDPPF